MKHKPPLSVQILIGLLLGVLAGLALQAAPDVAQTYIKPFGVLFLNLIKMVVVPLVFASITVGTCGLGDAKKVGRIGGKTILFYLCTTAGTGPGGARIRRSRRDDGQRRRHPAEHRPHQSCGRPG